MRDTKYTNLFRGVQYMATAFTAVIFVLAVFPHRWLHINLQPGFLSFGVLLGYAHLIGAFTRRLGAVGTETGGEYLAMALLLYATGDLRIWALILMGASLVLQLLALRRERDPVVPSAEAQGTRT